MKKILFFAILIVSILILPSCSDLDDGLGSPGNNEMKIENEGIYATPRAYLIYDDHPSPYQDAVKILLTDGKAAENNQGVALSTNTYHGIFLMVRFSNTMVASIDQVHISHGTYTALGSSSFAFNDIINFSNTFTYNGTEYGYLQDFSKYPINTSKSNELQITQISVNYVARNGYIECSYFYKDTMGNKVLGNYNGNFTILNGF